MRRWSSIATVLMISSADAWDSHLTDALLGEENAKKAARAREEGATHWQEVGVGVDPSGQPYAMPIARGKPYEHIEAGQFLVASMPEGAGGIFAQSVLLIISHDANGTLAIMVNKPAQLPADEHIETAEVYEELFGAEPLRPSVLLAGGPVPNPAPYFLHTGAPEGSTRKCYTQEQGGPRLYDSRGELLVAEEGEEGGTPSGVKVIEGVHFSGSQSFGRCALRDPSGAVTMRASVGHAGWGAQQLDGEYRRGDWKLCRATADLVFAPEAELAGLWKTLVYSPRGMMLCSGVGADMA